MKSIVLAGGSGTRLYPITLGISKQLMPIYDKPMIYYPLSILIEAGISEILIITNPEYIESFKRLLGDGSQLGCRFEYLGQDKPRGIADAFIVGEKFVGRDTVTLILGDNIFYGGDVVEKIKIHLQIKGGLVFASRVDDPQRYGVIEFDEKFKALSIEEKPSQPKSDYAIPGIYIFDNRVIKFAKEVKPSLRGEVEITEIQKRYLDLGELSVQVMSRGAAWLDTGTFESMMQASEFVKIIEQRQGIKIGCIEEAAFKAGLIDKEQILKLASSLMKSGYGKYLESLVTH